MELIYSMRRKPLKFEPPHFETITDPEVIRPLCTISSGNIIAFSSPTEVEDGDGETWGGHVYVCDLDTPWDCHKVTSTNDPVSVLEWDGEGKQLLVGTTVGHVAVYGQKDFLLNDWAMLYETNFPGEHILSAIFFHNGRRVVPTDKKSDVISDRLQTRYTPTLKGFGGVAQEGALIITSSGVVGAVLADPAAPDLPPDCLRSPREVISAAYTAHHNGKILIAWLPPSPPRCARCAAASLTPAGISLTPLPALHIAQPAALSWVIRDDTEHLLVAGTTLTLWKLAERAYPVHKLLSKGAVQGNANTGVQKANSDCFNTLVWQQSTAWSGPLGGAVRAEWSHCAAAVSPRALHTASLDSSRVTTYQLINPNSTDLVPTGASSPKKAKYTQGNLPPLSPPTVLSCVSVSPHGALAAVIDSRAQLHVLALSHTMDIATPLFLQNAQTILESALVSGHDYLDVLITLKPATLEALYDRITENFQRQPAPFQQYYYQRWLALRAALTRLSPTAQWACAWLGSLQALHAAGAAAAAAVQEPSDDWDCDKSLLALEAKAESEAVNLQWLRRPLQRALDTALAAVLTRRPHRTPHSGCANFELLSEPGAAALLRRLLLLARGVARTPRADLAVRAVASDKLTNDVIEECNAQWGAAPWPAWESLPRTCVSAPHARQRPLILQYGSAPERLRYTPERPPQLEAAPAPLLDAARYLYLGGGAAAARYRACGRCGAAASHARTAPDQRFLGGCRCGGKWTLVSNV